MTLNKTRISIIAVVFLAAGMFSGLLVSQFLTQGNAAAGDSFDVSAYLQELDSRLENMQPLDQAFVTVAKRVTPAIVTVSSERVVKPSDNVQQIPEQFRRFFNDDFFGPQGPQRQQGLGSGVIVDSGGIIITNNHVVSGFETITVTLFDKRTLTAKVIGTDQFSDIAVLKVEADNLPYLAFGDSEKAEVGEWVLAVGNPFSESLRSTVTAGIISAKDRSNVTGGFQNFIQTDAAINRGNSGGALVNMRGELIGINSMILSPTGANNGIGFAIPSNLVKNVKASLQKFGMVKRGYLGINFGEIDKNLARAFGLKRPIGAVVTEVQKDTPADKAGLKVEDVVIAVDGSEVANGQDLLNKISTKAPGETVELTVVRRGNERKIAVELAERQDERLVQSSPSQDNNQEMMMEDFGIELSELRGKLGEQARESFGTDGLLIRSVRGASIAEQAGLQVGMLITEVNRTPVSSIEDFRKELANLKAGDILLIKAQQLAQGGGIVKSYYALEVPQKK